MFSKIVILLLSSIYMVNGESYLFGCPPATDLRPCTCSKSWANTEWRVVVTCNNFIAGRDEFKKKLQVLKGYDINELSISGYGADRLPDNVFTNTLINRVSLLNSPKIFFWGNVSTQSTFFDGLGSSLHTIRIENSPYIREDQWPILAKSLTSDSVLKNLLIYNNLISAWSLDTFNGLKGLTNLEKIVNRSCNMSRNFQTDFSSFPNLRFIDLSDNNFIPNFSASGPTNQLSTISLNKNKIVAFDENTINNLSGLKSVEVSDNKLSCACKDMRHIMDNPNLRHIFTGKCSSPPLMVGQDFGPSCLDSKGVIKYFTDQKPNIQK